MSLSTKYTFCAEELKEEATRLQEISNKLRRKSIELRFDNHLLRKIADTSKQLSARPLSVKALSLPETDSPQFEHAAVCTVTNRSVKFI